MFILVNKQCAVKGSFVFSTILCALDPDTANFPPILLPSSFVAKLPVQGPAAKTTISASIVSSPVSVLNRTLFGLCVATFFACEVPPNVLEITLDVLCVDNSIPTT